MHPSPSSRPRFGESLLLSLAAALTFTGAAIAAPTLGFLESWPGASLQGWGGGSALSNPGAGGTGGATDGYLRFSTPNGGQRRLGVNSFGTEYAGDWAAAGITQVRLWLNDVGTDDPLEIHFSVGDGTSNFWQYNVSFLPPHDRWAEFVVDLSSDANWTRIIGAGTFAQALQAVDRVHVRHDLAPFGQSPDLIDADAGLDRVLLTNGVTGVAPGGPGAPRALELAAPMPNPSRGVVAFSLEMFDGGAVSLEIVDVTGRLVRRAGLAATGPGARAWTWDGRDASGRAAPAGYYRVRAVGAAGGASRGFVRLD
jgi:hypothetical protein